MELEYLRSVSTAVNKIKGDIEKMNVTVNDVKNMIENNKNKEFVVYVPNKILYDKLMKMFGELGIKWLNTERPTTKNYFGMVDEFCVNYTGNNNSIMYSRMGYYQERNEYIYTLIDDKPSVSAMMSRLGIEKNKPFDVEDNSFNPYTFDGRLIKDRYGDYADCDLVLSICAGESKIVNRTFPMVGKDYFFITEHGTVDYMEWTNNYIDYCFYLAGNAFPTNEKATAHIDEIMEKYNKIKGDIEK